MYVSELQGALDWIEANMVGKRVHERYIALSKILTANTQAGSPQTPLEPQKTELEVTLADISTVGLTQEQVGLLEALDIVQHVGSAGVSEVEDIIVRNPIDIATAASRIQSIAASVKMGVQRAQAMSKALKEIPLGLPPRVEMDEVLLRVRFRDKASIHNIVDLKKWAGIWHDIGRGITMVLGAAPEDIKVVGAATGSIIVDLGVAYGIAKTVSAILLEALKIADRVLDVRLKAQQVRALQLTNDEAAQLLEKAADDERDKRIGTIVITVMQQMGPANADGEKSNALTKAVENLVAFIEKGGQVDVVAPAPAEGEQGNAEIEQKRQDLIQTFADIRALEQKIALLEHQRATA